VIPTKTTIYSRLLRELGRTPKTWLLTGAAGFIGSHVLEALLRAGQNVIGLDNFSTGREANLGEVKSALPENQWGKFTLIEGDTSDSETVRRACDGADCVLHLAALGSVLGSFQDPLRTNANNVSGFLNVLVAARDRRVKRLVYASSSAVYGDNRELPNVEERAGRPLTPSAVSMAVNELYAQVFSRAYGLETIGLRFFNVFGPRQSAEGEDPPVVPRWVNAMLRNEQAVINGDGATSRDFCYVANAVQALLLAATTTNKSALSQVFNVGFGQQTSLNQLFEMIRQKLLPDYPHLKYPRLVYQDFRPGDIRHARADLTKAQRLLGYSPTHTLEHGLNETLAWHRRRAGASEMEGYNGVAQTQTALIQNYE
jgi:UDP-N-acetylglucosamine 4-epimerase